MRPRCILRMLLGLLLTWTTKPSMTTSATRTARSLMRMGLLGRSEESKGAHKLYQMSPHKRLRALWNWWIKKCIIDWSCHAKYTSFQTGAWSIGVADNGLLRIAYSIIMFPPTLRLRKGSGKNISIRSFHGSVQSFLFELTKIWFAHHGLSQTEIEYLRY